MNGCYLYLIGLAPMSLTWFHKISFIDAVIHRKNEWKKSIQTWSSCECIELRMLGQRIQILLATSVEVGENWGWMSLCIVPFFEGREKWKVLSRSYLSRVICFLFCSCLKILVRGIWKMVRNSNSISNSIKCTSIHLLNNIHWRFFSLLQQISHFKNFSSLNSFPSSMHSHHFPCCV